MKHTYSLFAALVLAGCVQTPAVSIGKKDRHPVAGGIASFYGGGERLNRHTANGEVFRPGARTAAHRTLPFGTMVLVTNKLNGLTCTVRITDRGPAAWTGRVIDLSRGAAQDCGYVARGTTRVALEVIK